MEKILHFNPQKMEAMESRYRANFINSVTGLKSASLIGTISENGIDNLAVFSSITHLGSNPPLLGFVMRPVTVPRHTYKNIKDTGVFTVNHIHTDLIKQAHQTAASYGEETSEFEKTGLTSEVLNHFKAPFVKEAHIKIGCEYVNEYRITENDTILVIGAIKEIHIPQNTLMEDGWIDLSKANGVTINGLDGYAAAHLIDRYSYSKPEKDIISLLK